MLEEDVRAVLRMVRPHRRQRLMGWKEYRTGGADFRITISWSDEFEPPVRGPLIVPRMADIVEALLVGSARRQDELTVGEEFALYRAVVKELRLRIDEMESRYS